MKYNNILNPTKKRGINEIFSFYYSLVNFKITIKRAFFVFFLVEMFLELKNFFFKLANFVWESYKTFKEKLLKIDGRHISLT